MVATPASAQTSPTSAPAQQSTLGSEIDADTLRDLPLGENLYSLGETIQPEVIADRFSSAGLNVGAPARLGAFLASWSQTSFRIGDVDVSDPTGRGASLLFPEILFWRHVEVSTGMMPDSLSAPGLAFTLEPRRPTSTWVTMVNASGSGGSLASSTPSGLAPPIVRLRDWAHASGLISGPASERVGIVAGGTWTRGSKFERESMAAGDSDVASGFMHVVFTPSATSEWRTIGWFQRAQGPFAYWQAFGQPAAATRDISTHVQSTWESRSSSGTAWRVFGGFTAQSQTTDTSQTPSLKLDRVTDGPIASIVASVGDTTTERWTLGARVEPRTVASRHATEIGVDLDGALTRTSDEFTGPVGELVNGIPARMWVYANSGVESRRHSTTVGLFAGDHITMSPTLHLEAGVRFESVSGSADGAVGGVGWRTLLPRANLRWEFASRAHKTLVVGYRRAANRLNLDLLAVGDPTASTATVTRWLPASLSSPLVVDPRAPIVARVGPGTGGDTSFSRIDPELKRPYTDEFLVGVQSRPRPSLRLGLMGIARREADLVGLVNVGVSPSDYSTVGIPDPGVDLARGANQVLTIYNRLPSSFGQDRYLLTNPDEQAATVYALTLTAESVSDRLFLLFGATASAATGSAASTGYGPLENDQDEIGELFSNPNAATYARGRLFLDRAFTIKWTTVYRFPGDLRLGAIARYQDGQPFARLVIAPGLNQGPEAVRAYANGGTRFTYTGTLDLRLQKGFTIAGSHVDVIVDLYNLLTRSNEVEEYVVTGDNFRKPTAIEPPRSIHLGVRLTF
jgi:hypothetical protein